jgi:hypothetical protein
MLSACANLKLQMAEAALLWPINQQLASKVGPDSAFLLPLHHTLPVATENVQSMVLRSWYPVLLIFTFNITDFIGRCTPDFGWDPKQATLLLLSLGRLVVFQVLYPVSAVKGAGEAVFFVLTALLGFSNGWLTALIFCAVPRGLSPSAAELAGNLNVFCELGGLTVGAFLGWMWTM